MKKHGGSITVLGKTFNEKFVEQYAENPERWSGCTHGYRPVFFKLEKLAEKENAG